MGDDNCDWFIACYGKNTTMINEETENNSFKLSNQHINHFFTVEIAEVDVDMP